MVEKAPSLLLLWRMRCVNEWQIFKGSNCGKQNLQSFPERHGPRHSFPHSPSADHFYRFLNYIFSALYFHGEKSAGGENVGFVAVGILSYSIVTDNFNATAAVGNVIWPFGLWFYGESTTATTKSINPYAGMFHSRSLFLSNSHLYSDAPFSSDIHPPPLLLCRIISSVNRGHFPEFFRGDTNAFIPHSNSVVEFVLYLLRSIMFILILQMEFKFRSFSVQLLRHN